MTNPKVPEEQGGKRAPSSPTALDVMNRHIVTTRQLGGEHVIIGRPPSRLTKAEALVFAAWLVCMAESINGDVTFAQALRAVRNT
jgi:hypothetical protein